MNDWFTIEKIDADTFAISEYKHWEQVHSYLLCGTKRAVLIDTGLGVANIRETVEQLTELPIMVVTTHVHWDHIGGHRFFKDNIAVHEMEKEWLSEQFPIPPQLIKKNLTYQSCVFPADFKIDEYQVFKGEPQHILHDGDCIELGNREIRVIHTPGHSPGHCCFYEPERKYLYSGDLIYKGCLDMYYESTNPELFWQSIKAIKEMKINRILPGHYDLDVPTEMIEKIDQAFTNLSKEGKLKHGSGTFDYGCFQLHV